MPVFTNEAPCKRTSLLKRELVRLKRKRTKMLAKGEKARVAAIEQEIEGVRERLGRAEERNAILEAELKDVEHLRSNHTLEEYEQLKARGVPSIHELWGVNWGTLRHWVKKEREKLEQTQATAVESITQEQLQRQVEDLQDMLHGYENELNAASDAHNATIDELAKVRAELECVRNNFTRTQKDLKHAQDMLQREKVRNASHQATIRELEREVDEYATLLGDAEQQHNVLKQVAKPLLQQVLDAL